MVLLLSLIACNPERALDDDALVTDPIPAGQDKAPDAAPDGERIATRARTLPAAAAPAPPPRDLPATPMVQRDCGLGPSSGGLGAIGGSGMGRGGGYGHARPAASRTPSPVASPPPPEASPSPAAERSARADDGVADARPGPPLAEPVEREAKREEAQQQRISRAPAEPTLDWGATVYLSNDDSMSLASAQRLLWAVDQGRGFQPAEVRPHELLNYFSFDTVPVSSGLFSVLGTAAQDGETLSLALAVQGASPPRQPLDLTLVIDRSGSMYAEGRIDYVKRGLLQMTEQLQPGDRVDLVLFDSRVCTPLQDFVVGRDDGAVLSAAIQSIVPNGATDLDGGLREGYRIQSARDAGDVHGRNRRVLLLTDALLNTGNVDDDLVSEVGRRFEQDGIRVTGVGVGRDFNDTMLNKLTEKGKGAYVFLGSEAVVDRVFGAGFNALVQTIAHDVQFALDLPDSLAMTRFYGEEASTVAADVQPIHYYAGTSQVFLQDLRLRGEPVRTDPVTLTIAYRDALTGEPHEQVFRTTVGELLDGEQHNLVKAQALMAWTDLLAARAMGDRACSGLNSYRSAAAQVQGDAEIAYVSSLTGKLCGVDMSQTVAATGVSFKVKVDADLPIPEVRLACGGASFADALSGGDTVARFEGVPAGTCDLVLSGQVPMRAAVKVPSTGGDVRCLVRGGRMNCG